MTTQLAAPPGDHVVAGPRKRRRYWIVLSVSVTAALVAVIVAFVGWTGGQSAQAAQLDRTANACHMWAATDPLASSAWCDDMVGWMRQQVSDHGVSGMMLWATPTAMQRACREWSATSAGFDPGRCDRMVTWMTQHVPSSNGWMMRGGGMMRH